MSMFLRFGSNLKRKCNVLSRLMFLKNKHLKSSDPKQESKHIISLEANNLHGYV